MRIVSGFVGIGKGDMADEKESCFLQGSGKDWQLKKEVGWRSTEQPGSSNTENCLEDGV